MLFFPETPPLLLVNELPLPETEVPFTEEASFLVLPEGAVLFPETPLLAPPLLLSEVPPFEAEEVESPSEPSPSSSSPPPPLLVDFEEPADADVEVVVFEEADAEVEVDFELPLEEAPPAPEREVPAALEVLLVAVFELIELPFTEEASFLLLLLPDTDVLFPETELPFLLLLPLVPEVPSPLSSPPPSSAPAEVLPPDNEVDFDDEVPALPEVPALLEAEEAAVDFELEDLVEAPATFPETELPFTEEASFLVLPESAVLFPETPETPPPPLLLNEVPPFEVEVESPSATSPSPSSPLALLLVDFEEAEAEAEVDFDDAEAEVDFDVAEADVEVVFEVADADTEVDFELPFIDALPALLFAEVEVPPFEDAAEVVPLASSPSPPPPPPPPSASGLEKNLDMFRLLS